ncbi:hypothetical protein [Lichenifustis flavocetrariae]|uniref:Uncharacterized protein n=1 Tax=Lichenifustis flavocetrariae TaxID=2949735 RepID=A0AA41YTU0_9HYPH|nr:hypothetical protein [Lichenifustis flavocetrariae]MCW6506907.1 hypothetical protein [Lichenifustis flavocetrariae]
MTSKADRTRDEVVEQMRTLVRTVRAGETTPVEAEEKCAREGLPLPHEGWQDLHDITTNSVWWLPLASLFYAWRDLGHTREQWERFGFWGRDLWRDETDERQVMSLQEAEAMLKSDLAQGILRAFGTDAEGVVRPIAYDAWRELSIGPDRSFNAFDAEGTIIFAGVFVLRHEVVPLLISEKSAPSGEPFTRGRLDDTAPKRLGAAQKYDWPSAAGFAAAYGMHYDYPPVKAVFAERVGLWFKGQGKVPDPRDLDRFVAELYKGLDQKPEK